MTDSTTTSTQDETTVRAVLDEVYAAWAANDADAFVAGYAEDATAVLPGSLLPNRAAIHAAMAAGFAGPLKGSHAEHEVQSIRFLGADAAIVIGTGAVILAGQTKPAPETRSLDTWVLSRQDESWRVRAFHNCPGTVG